MYSFYFAPDASLSGTINLQLTANSTLAMLPVHDFIVDAYTITEAIAETLSRHPELPGVIVVQQDTVGMISRQQFFERLGQRYGVAVHMNRPIDVMLNMVDIPPLLLPATTTIPQATKLALARPRDFVYEPIVVQLNPQTYYLLDVYTLLIAHSEIFVRIQNQLQEAKTELEKRFDQLQQQALRLAEAKESAEITNQVLSKRTTQLQAARQVSKRITSILDVDELLLAVVQVVQKQFDYYFVGVWLINDTPETLELQAGVDHDGKQITSRLEMYIETTRSIVTTAYHTKKYYLTNNVNLDKNYTPSELLPKTLSALAIPLRIKHGKTKEVTGILDIQDDHLDAFEKEDRKVLQLMANEIAIAIQNAQSYSLSQKANKELARLNADKDKFFSIVAHDLKGPFMPLLGNLELLAEMGDTFDPQEIKEMGQSLHRTAKNVFNLLENLLHWSRMQMGRMEYNPETINLQDIALETINLLAAPAESKKITLQSTISDEMQVYADSHMVDTIIRNLTNNAIKFTPEEGTVTISAIHANHTTDTIPITNAIDKIIYTLSTTQFIEIAVTDTGVGMDEAVQAKLFHIDQPHSTVGTAKESGTGLGLIMCKEMVERNGGKIWVESEIGAGTAVKFTLPNRQFAQPVV